MFPSRDQSLVPALLIPPHQVHVFSLPAKQASICLRSDPCKWLRLWQVPLWNKHPKSTLCVWKETKTVETSASQTIHGQGPVFLACAFGYYFYMKKIKSHLFIHLFCWALAIMNFFLSFFLESLLQTDTKIQQGYSLYKESHAWVS